MDPEALQCPNCDKTFAQRKKLNLHRKLCHEPRGQEYTCSFCNKSFAVQSNLRRHKRSLHLGESRPRTGGAECQVCRHKCRDHFQLNIHLRRHTRDRPFACDLCKKTFASKADTARHRARCSGQPRNVCPTCRQPFSSLQLLNRHYLWDADCGRLRQLHQDGDAGGASSLEIFRLQTADSENDIIGARRTQLLSSGVSKDPPVSAGGNRLSAASQRRVRCGVCINCSRGEVTASARRRRCLHPVKYFKIVKPDTEGGGTGARDESIRSRSEAEGNVDTDSWLSQTPTETAGGDSNLPNLCLEVNVFSTKILTRYGTFTGIFNNVTSYCRIVIKWTDISVQWYLP